MTNTNKYYNPTLEEMCVGFECEMSHKTKAPDESEFTEEWKPITIDAEILWSVVNFETKGYGFPLTGFRVPYLDKADIEKVLQQKSVHELDDYPSYGVQYTKPITNRIYEASLTYESSTKEIIVEYYAEYVEGSGNFSEFTLFRGFTKNKSELIKLLKLLNIKPKQ
jgi:hypothetical protein